MIQLENYSQLETFKGIKKKNTNLEQIFAELKFNKKKPKYNYHSGLTAGLLIGNLADLQNALKNKDKEKFLVLYLKQVAKGAKVLVESYNWNLYDLNQLAFQFFGDDE